MAIMFHLRLSNPGQKIKFLDVVTSVRAEAKRLKNNGVKLLIALGHAGFETDKKVASDIEELDIVVGGHTNTFLYNGKFIFIKQVKHIWNIL